MKRYLLFFIFAMCLFLVKAENFWTDRGSYSVSWFNAAQSEFEISTPAEFAGLAVLQNEGYTNFSNKTIILKNDIDLSGKVWIPIGSKSNPFRGKIEGNGHSIEGMDVEYKEDCHYYGLFGGLYKAKFYNFHIVGKINIIIENEFNSTQYVGSCCGYAEESYFKEIVSNVNVTYERHESNAFKYDIRIGGFAGDLYNCDLTNVHFDGDYYVEFGGYSLGYYLQSSDFYFGGLYAKGFNSKINYCSVKSSNVYVYLGGSQNLTYSRGTQFGGIASDTNCTIIGCNVIIENIEINNGAKHGIPCYICIGGISVLSSPGTKPVKRGIYDCYVVVNNVKTSLADGEFRYGGIMGMNADLNNFSDRYVFNYSNNDVEITNTLGNHSFCTYAEGYEGFDVFSSEEMKSQEFTDELNLYYTLNGQNPQWYFDGFNYPYIDEEKAGIEETTRDNDLIDIQEVFNLHGNKVGSTTANLPQGIYIVRQGNDIKKVYVK